MAGFHNDHQEHYTIEQMADAIRASRGLQSEAARMLKCTYKTVHNYIKRYPELQKILDDTNEINLDISENQLFNQIDQGNPPSIFFHLKCKGKHRGYIERTEVEHSGGIKLDVDQRINVVEEIKKELLDK